MLPKDRFKGVILEAIAEFKDRGVPSGHLYAAVMQAISLGMYQTIISELVSEGKITDKYHLLQIVKQQNVDLLRTGSIEDAKGDEFDVS